MKNYADNSYMAKEIKVWKTLSWWFWSQKALLSNSGSTSSKLLYLTLILNFLICISHLGSQHILLFLMEGF